MARYPGTEHILKAVRDWRDRCLLDDRSILTDQEIWNAPNLTELDTRLQLIEEDSDADQDAGFDFEQLLSGVSRGSRKLTAEILWAMLLFPSDEWDREEKQEWVRSLWEGTGQQLPIKSQEYLDALGPGVAPTGSLYRSNLGGEFRFFLDFIQNWKEFSKSRRHGLMNKPWNFGQWVDEQAPEEEFQLRHILLHLLFPNYFERVPNTSEKNTIVKVFSSFEDLELESSPEEKSGLTSIPFRIKLDVKLHQIRKIIGPMLPDSMGVDFYDPPLEPIWRPHEGVADPTPEETSIQLLLPEEDPQPDQQTEAAGPQPVEPPNQGEQVEQRWLWLSMDAERWNFHKAGGEQTEFLAYSDSEGRPRVEKKAFEKARSGDPVLFFQTAPEARVVARGEVEQGLHDGTDVDGNKKVGLTFHVKETVNGPTLESLHEDMELAGHHVIENPTAGTLFELDQAVYERILNQVETVTETDTREDPDPPKPSSESSNSSESPTSEMEMNQTVNTQWSDSEPDGQLAKLGALLGFEVRQNAAVKPDSTLNVLWISRANGEEKTWTGFEIYEAASQDSTIVKFQKILRQDPRVQRIVLVGGNDDLSSFQEEISFLEEEMQKRIKYLPRQQLGQTAQHINALNDFLSRLGWLDDEVQFGTA